MDDNTFGISRIATFHSITTTICCGLAYSKSAIKCLSSYWKSLMNGADGRRVSGASIPVPLQSPRARNRRPVTNGQATFFILHLRITAAVPCTGSTVQKLFAPPATPPLPELAAGKLKVFGPLWELVLTGRSLGGVVPVTPCRSESDTCGTGIPTSVCAPRMQFRNL